MQLPAGKEGATVHPNCHLQASQKVEMNDLKFDFENFYSSFPCAALKCPKWTKQYYPQVEYFTLLFCQFG